MTGAPLDPDEVEAFRRARAAVLGRIDAAARRAGRDPAGVLLVAVSKTVPAGRVRAAVAAGLDVLGENRVQEGAAKIPEVDGAAWHLLGPLQGNKARRAVELFDVLQAVDSVDLARRLDQLAGELRPGRPLPILLQVNVAGDPAKAGLPEDAVAAVLPYLAGMPNLRLDGLMTIGRLVDDPEAARPTFRALRDLSVRLRAAEPRLGAALSMGMSDDFEVAVEEGATVVRVGRALFGSRPTSVRPDALPGFDAPR
jgi:pyridoxal phosphate enzyme (YggS family)